MSATFTTFLYSLGSEEGEGREGVSTMGQRRGEGEAEERR
jgi:hypothetical protein